METTDKILEIWEQLPETHTIKVENNSFEYPENTPYLKGIFQGDLGHRTRFMCFSAEMHVDNEHIDSLIFTFYQKSPYYWVFTMSDSNTRGTFRHPIVCCVHTVRLIENLFAGKPANMHLRNADNKAMVAKIHPTHINQDQVN